MAARDSKTRVEDRVGGSGELPVSETNLCEEGEALGASDAAEDWYPEGTGVAETPDWRVLAIEIWSPSERSCWKRAYKLKKTGWSAPQPSVSLDWRKLSVSACQR